MHRDAVAAWISQRFAERGDTAYLGEPVSQSEHALQAAHAAERAGAAPPLIAAALLHDFGHLLHDLPEDCADQGIDDRHEVLGASWLSKYFVAAVVEPVRLHVPAKRYLCAVEPNYRARLSEASIESLQLQGGPMSTEEAARFRDRPYWGDALALRRWDEWAKEPGRPTPPLSHFLPFVQLSLLPVLVNGHAHGAPLDSLTR